MLCMCETLFYMVKDVVIDSTFWFANVIFTLATKGVYDGALIKKLQYWPKIAPRDIIDRNSKGKEVGGVYMLEDATEDSNIFLILYFKDTDCMMNFVAYWMTLDDL